MNHLLIYIISFTFMNYHVNVIYKINYLISFLQVQFEYIYTLFRLEMVIIILESYQGILSCSHHGCPNSSRCSFSIYPILCLNILPIGIKPTTHHTARKYEYKVIMPEIVNFLPFE